MIRRLGTLLTYELRTQWRQGVPASMLGLAVCWAALLTVLPAPAARIAAPYLLFLEIMTVGTLFVGALTIADRATGAVAALAVSPARPSERLAARLAPLTVLTAVSAVPVLVAGRRTGQIGAGVPAIALAGLLLLAVAVAVAVRRSELVSFMVALTVPMVLLFAVPLAVSIGLLTGPLWYATPTTGALMLLLDDSPYPAAALIGYLAMCVTVAVGYAARRLLTGHEPAAGRPTAHVRALPSRPRWLVFPRADLRNITGALLLAVPLAPLMTLGTLAVARTRVQGVTADKMLALPAYLPIGAWWLAGPAAWLLAPLPTYWIARSWSGAGPLQLLAGLACVAAWLTPLGRRVVHRLQP